MAAIIIGCVFTAVLLTVIRLTKPNPLAAIEQRERAIKYLKEIHALAGKYKK